MKYVILIFIGLFFFRCKKNRDVRYLPSKQTSEFNKLLLNDNKDSLRTKVCDFFEESSEGGEIRGYYIGNQLKKIEIELYGELGKVQKEFMNDTVPDLYAFKQSYFFYDKPINEAGFRIIDTVVITGSFSDGVLDNDVAGERMSDIEINKVLSNINLSREKYAVFLSKCSDN